MNNSNEPCTQETYEGFAIVEIMGRNVARGYVRTKYFGGTAMLHVVRNEQPDEEITIDRAHYVNGTYLYPGSRVRRFCQREEQYINVASLYRFTPCQEIETISWSYEILERAAPPTALPAPTDQEQPEEDPDEDLSGQIPF